MINKDVLRVTLVGDSIINPFSTNVPIMDKLGSWFSLAKYLKNSCGRVTF